MKNGPDLTPIVQSWLRAQAIPLPDDVRQWVVEQLPLTPQQGARWPALRLPHRIGTAKLAVVTATAAIVVTVGGVGLLSRPDRGIGGTPPSVSPSPAVPLAMSGPVLGTDIPPGATSGVIDTHIGRARWVHLTGDGTSLPLAAPFARGSTFVALEDMRDDEGSFLARVRWTSTDGMRWTTEPLSIPVGASFPDFQGDDETSWVATHDPASLWRSTDQALWEPIDLGGIAPVSSPALDWDVEIGSIATAGDLTAVELIFTAEAPFEGWPDYPPSKVTEVEPGRFSIRPRGEDPEPRRLRFEETPEGLVLIDESDGTEFALPEGFTLDFARHWVLNGPPAERLVALVDGDRLVPTSTPGPKLGDPEADPPPAMLGTPDGVIVMELPDPAGPAVAWRLDGDGTWTELGPWDISVPTGGTFYIGDTSVNLQSDPATNELYALYDGPGTLFRRSWRSSDGLHWKQALDSPPRGVPMALPSGYLELQWEPAPRTWWASADGSAWYPLDLSTIGLTTDLLGYSPDEGDPDLALGVVGETAFIVIDDRAGTRQMWVLSFNEGPGVREAP